MKIQSAKGVLYVLPGFGETTRKFGYKNVIQMARLKGYVVIPISIDWREGKIADEYIDEIISQISTLDGDISALGFSFGAYFLAILSKRIKFRKIYFCSLSPYFKKYISSLPESAIDYFKKEFIDNASKNNFPLILKSEVFFFIGGMDLPVALTCTTESYNKCRGSKKLIIIEGAGHDMSNSQYLKAIEKTL